MEVIDALVSSRAAAHILVPDGCAAGPRAPIVLIVADEARDDGLVCFAFGNSSVRVLSLVGIGNGSCKTVQYLYFRLILGFNWTLWHVNGLAEYGVWRQDCRR